MKKSPLERKFELQRKSPLRPGRVPERVVSWGASESTRSTMHQREIQPRKPARRRDTGPSAKVRAALKVRSGGLCEIDAPGCTELAVDPSHRVKTGMGGRKGAAAVRHHVLSNLLAACRSCHSFGHANPAAAYAAGWMLREHQNPLTEPVVYRGRWCLLADDGAVSVIDPIEEESVPNYIQEIESRLRQLSTKPLSDGQARAYAQLVLTTGVRTTLENVHDAWAVDRNVDRPDHEDIVPFDQLHPAVAEWDRPFLDLVHRVAAELAPAEAA